MLPALLASLLTACATTGPAIEPQPQIVTRTRVIDTGCQTFKPVYISKADVLTNETADDILANNVAGERQCGWKPRGK
ncbi:hypothetical protein LMG32289_03912 [Cupriavidus pampae]|uniref:Lipoprotein n=1 Tax=Cupriavidus pampae TaxID=659251 RepID=A0ABM8XCJ9_9BURK|nr:hypothetical protein LMG32289_03912 [Cupriavidus pampae]